MTAEKSASWLRSLIFVIAFYGWTLFVPVVLLWILLLPKRALHSFLVIWQKQLAWLERSIIGLDYKVIGRGHIPEGPCIIAAKHESAFETCIMHILFWDPAIVLKEELTRIPIWGWYGKASGMIPIDRGRQVKALTRMMKAARKAKDEGRKIVIFPQGTRVLPGVKKPYKSGVAALYKELNLPIVPMALNSGLFWPKNQFIKKSGTVTIEFLPPIPAGLPRAEMMKELETKLEAASNRLAGIA